eukprot:1841473-Rhodomonas_salina.2
MVLSEHAGVRYVSLRRSTQPAEQDGTRSKTEQGGVGVGGSAERGADNGPRRADRKAPCTRRSWRGAAMIAARAAAWRWRSACGSPSQLGCAGRLRGCATAPLACPPPPPRTCAHRCEHAEVSKRWMVGVGCLEVADIAAETHSLAQEAAS